MKKIINYLPYLFYVFGFLSFILPVVYIKDGDSKIYFNTLELTFGKDSQSASIGLIIVLLMFLTTIIISIITSRKSSKMLENIAITLGLASGALLFFSRMISNPNVTNLNVHIGLFLPGIFIIIGTIILFINKKVLRKNA